MESFDRETGSYARSWIGFGLSDVKLATATVAEMVEKTGVSEALGRTTGERVINGVQAIIEVAADPAAGDGRTRLATLHHEAVHALKHMGLFTREEWRALERYARQHPWFKQTQKLCAGETPEIHTEETVANSIF